MNICVGCRKEMTCEKTGRDAVWHGHHAYRGDVFRCRECGAEVLICTPSPYYVETPDADAIDMTEKPAAVVAAGRFCDDLTRALHAIHQTTTKQPN